MRRSDVPPSFPPRFVVLRLAVPSCASVFVPPSNPTPVQGPGVFGSGNPQPAQEGRRLDLSSSWGTLVCLCPALSTPAGTVTSGHTMHRRGPRFEYNEGYPRRVVFGAQLHGLDTRCLRFARCIATEDARRACRCWPDSTERDWLPAGFLRKVSLMLLTSLPPFPSLLDANPFDPVPELYERTR
jgi:hypothetical protein